MPEEGAQTLTQLHGHSHGVCARCLPQALPAAGAPGRALHRRASGSPPAPASPRRRGPYPAPWLTGRGRAQSLLITSSLCSGSCPRHSAHPQQQGTEISSAIPGQEAFKPASPSVSDGVAFLLILQGNAFVRQNPGPPSSLGPCLQINLHVLLDVLQPLSTPGRHGEHGKARHGTARHAVLRAHDQAAPALPQTASAPHRPETGASPGTGGRPGAVPAVTSVGHVELAHEVDGGQGTAAPGDALGRPLLLDLVVLGRQRVGLGSTSSSPRQQAEVQAAQNSVLLLRQAVVGHLAPRSLGSCGQQGHGFPRAVEWAGENKTGGDCWNEV